MIHPAIPVTLLALAAPAASAIVGPQDSVTLAQLTIRERVVIRIPRMAMSASPGRVPLPAVVWKEKKGPRCINPMELGGAIFGQPGQVDLVLTGNRRLRAKFGGGCGPLDFYSGVYLRPGSDGKFCADRDAIRTRSGATCEINAFRTLVASR